MAKKMYYRYGAMGSGKSLEMIRAVYNYRERGMEVLVYKSAVDTREGTDGCLVKSRTGSSIEGKWLPKDTSIYDLIADDVIKSGDIRAIFVDEAQFLNEGQVDELQKICYNYNIPILCYGLKVDFQSHLFAGAKRLIEVADHVDELIGICHCGKRAKQNARIVNGVMVRDGEVVKIGGSNTDRKQDEVHYVALCNECYFEGRVK